MPDIYNIYSLERQYSNSAGNHMPFTVLFYEFLNGRDIADVHERDLEMRKVRSLRLYGKKLIKLANAGKSFFHDLCVVPSPDLISGSFYILILLAVKGLSTLKAMSESEVADFANHLRSPIRAYLPGS